MSENDTHIHLLDVDEAWLAEWAREGIEAIERYLAKHAAFAEYLSRRAASHCDGRATSPTGSPRRGLLD
jgi:hypothetical protein